MAVEKGQKYKHKTSGNVYEILSEPFESPRGKTLVAYWNPISDCVQNSDVDRWDDNFTLIREPKFKVGDRVWRGGYIYEIVAVTSVADFSHDFGYVGLDSSNTFALLDDSEGLKAAE